MAQMDNQAVTPYGTDHLPCRRAVVATETPLVLDCGQTLSHIPVAYQTYGRLNADRTNAVLVCHALTGDQYVIEPHPMTGKEGWWIRMVGPGRPIDTDRYFVICANALGSCMGTLGPREVDPATGKVVGRVTQRHRSQEFVAFLRQIESEVPADLDVHLIVDNSSTHKTALVAEFKKAHPRFYFHFTPTSASWLNAVESWFSQLERRSIHRGIFTSVQELRNEIKRYIKAHNAESAKPFVWTQTAEKIIKAVERAKSAVQTVAN